jgi:hypothetical protein
MIHTGNPPAAVMDEGDGGFSVLANELDGMPAGYLTAALRENAEIRFEVVRKIHRIDPCSVLEAEPWFSLEPSRFR